MSVIKNFPVLEDDNNVLLGDGYLSLGGAGTDYCEIELETAGGLHGVATFTPKVETTVLEAGSPMMPIDVEPIRIGCELKVTMLEMSMRKLKKIIGIGTWSIIDATTPAITGEEIRLFGKYWVHLLGKNIKDAPVLVVQSTDPTPVTYVLNTDYKVNLENGLLRRLSAGSIVNGEQVVVSYTYEKPAYEEIKVGTEKTVNSYPLKFTVPMPDGNRYSIKIWKAVPTEIGAINHQADDFTTQEITFIGLADRTRDPDELLYKLEKETETYYTLS